MKDKVKGKIIYIVISAALFLVTVIGATYAYFASYIELEGFNTQVLTSTSSYIFTASSDGEVDLHIDSSMMMQSQISSNEIAYGDAFIDIKLSSPSTSVITTCKYDILWSWDEGSDIYDKKSGYLGEVYKDLNGKICGEYNAENMCTILSGSYPYEFSVKLGDELPETNLTEFNKQNDGSLILIKDAQIVSQTIVEEQKSYDIDVKIYNLPYNQDDIRGKRFNAHIKVDNVRCTMKDVVTTE